ncbi:MAG: DNA repair protein RecO [Pseudomonadota bacterium]
MDWRDEGMILAVRPLGENGVILDAFTPTHGRHSGLVRGGTGRKLRPVLQPGNQVELEWRARLEDHLGNYRVELLQSRTGLMGDRLTLAGLGAVCALLVFALPERLETPRLYHETQALLRSMALGDGAWVAQYARWELLILEDTGFGLDLGTCAATGTDDDLIYVSPKSGRAVSAGAGAPYAAQMLPLSPVLSGAAGDPRSQRDALRTTGHFLSRWLAPAQGDRPVPAARGRFIDLIERRK